MRNRLSAKAIRNPCGGFVTCAEVVQGVATGAYGWNGWGIWQTIITAYAPLVREGFVVTCEGTQDENREKDDKMSSEHVFLPLELGVESKWGEEGEGEGEEPVFQGQKASVAFHGRIVVSMIL